MSRDTKTARVSRITAILLAAAILFAVVSPAFAQTAQRTVRVGFFAMDGYHMQDARGARSGYGYDFLQYVARYSHLRFEYVGYDKSWEQMQEMLANGEIDLLTSVQKTPEREKLFIFSDTLLGTSSVILTVKAGDNRYADGNYAGMRVGLIRANSRNEQFAQFMAERGFAYTPVYYDEMDDLTGALQDGTDIDAAMTSTLRWTEKEWTLEQFDPSPFYAIARKDDTALMTQLNAAVERMDADSAGWRTKLFNKYYSMGSGEVVAFTASERAFLDALNAQGRVLTVTMNPDACPYSYFENGRAMGIIPDIFAEVAARMGIAYTIVEPADREEYRQMAMNRSTDIILDGLDDFYTVEENGLAITDAYYTAPLAALTAKSNSGEIQTLARPSASLLNEAPYAYVFEGKTVSDKAYASLEEIARDVQGGAVDGAYMPYYCAQWLANADVTGTLKCLMLPKYDRAFVYAVHADEDYRLIASLTKALKSVSDDFIASVVTADTEYPGNDFSLLGFLYRNIIPVACFAVVFIAIVVAALFLADKNRRAQKELARSRRLERYIGYLCDMYYKVLEVDLERKSRIQYMKHNDAVEIEERHDFTGFDIASIHPDDVQSSLAIFDPANVRQLAASGAKERYVESRMLSDNGEYRWYSFLLKLIPVDDAHPLSAMLLIKDVDDLHRERERNHDALVAALDAANAASRSKSTFLSSMSHEIRTPLNAMIGYMTIASASIENREKVLHCIESAGVAARHLLSIINDVLDISSMESGKMKLAKDRFDLKEQLSGVTSVFYQQCKQKGVQFAVTVNGLTEEWVVGDPLRVSQILINLMSNAVKFTDAGGSVNMTVIQTALTDNTVYIRFIVKDTGIGMSEEYIGRLFTPFEQESAQTARKYGGTGLGMSITYNLVHLMGGKLDVTSTQGAGSTFTVTLPFARTENTEHKPISADFSKLRVLVVDDLENECDYVHALLTRCGVRSESATSGEDAVRLVGLRKDTPDRFDLCIIDWNMPGLNGVETTRLIHQECDPDIPIIIATAYDISEFEEEALAAGAAKIISKPLFQSTLFDLLVTTYGKYDATPEDANDIPHLAGMRALLAEDNEMNVEVAVELLELADVQVSVAKDGRQALDLFLSPDHDFDVILMDVQMPGMDGYAATKAIRESGHAKAKTIPIIAMTANAFAEDVSASLAAGMNGHLSKPIETDALYGALKRIGQN